MRAADASASAAASPRRKSAGPILGTMRKDVVLGAAGILLGAALASSVPLRARASLLTYHDLLALGPPLADRRIAYGPLPDQFGELWLPAHRLRPKPIILIHGGCWRADLPGLELMNFVAADLRRRGFAVWNIEYRRLGGDGGWPATFDDVAQAVDFLRVLARAENLDLGRVTAVGHSAGGQLALWAAGRHALPSDHSPRSRQPLHIAAVTTLAGINDLYEYRTHGPDACGGPKVIDELIGAPVRGLDTALRESSPPRLLPLKASQAVISGALDPIVPPRFGHAYATKARAAGDRVTEVVIPSAGHFELIDPAAPAWGRVVREIEHLAR